jgi:aminoglycoside phosphotransferase family enzyme
VHQALQSAGEPALADKVAFLSRRETYAAGGPEVTRHETHMSWVFMVGDRVYKLKKPVRFPYLDFSTLAKREAACRAELRLNRRLAPDVYLDVVPLVATKKGLSIGGRGSIVDWLVVMRRLDVEQMLEPLIIEHRVETRHLDRLIVTLAQFYERASTVHLSPAAHLHEWRRSLAYNKRVLLDSRLGMPHGLVRWLDAVQLRFLKSHARVLAARVRGRHIVDGHGDLRPEHIWLGHPVRIIDCLEFNPRLRAVDPYDEVAFLALECERLGAAWVGDYIQRRMMRMLPHGPGQELFAFYRCHRATLRARLAIAHLLEPNPRTPEKWPKLARAYLAVAAKDAVRLERALRKRASRPKSRSGAIGRSPRPGAAPPAVLRSFPVLDGC